MVDVVKIHAEPRLAVFNQRLREGGERRREGEKEDDFIKIIMDAEAPLK